VHIQTIKAGFNHLSVYGKYLYTGQKAKSQEMLDVQSKLYII